MKIDALNLSKMQSGNLSLELSEKIDWDIFPAYIYEILNYTSGKITNKNDLHDMRMWNIEIDGLEVRVVYEDFPQMASVESDSLSANEFLEKLFEQFKNE